MAREEQLLSSAIADTLRKARVAETQLSRVCESIRSVNEINDPHNYTLADAEGALGFYLEKAYRDLSILAERLNIPLFAQDLQRQFRSYRRKGLTNMDHHPDDSGLHSPALSKLDSYYESLATMTHGRAVTGIDVFRTILENTPAIVSRRKPQPSKESEIRNTVYDFLKLAFNDVVRDVPIGHVLKSYKPDVGVRSLMAAAEFKFVVSERELNQALDGIYSDMKGYSGSDEWRTFFAVIYTTVPVANKAQLEEEFRGVRADTNWYPIIVFGPGRRELPIARQNRDDRLR